MFSSETFMVNFIF